jgi:hypothetical protein
VQKEKKLRDFEQETTAQKGEEKKMGDKRRKSYERTGKYGVSL